MNPLLDTLQRQFNTRIALHERRPGVFQLIVPLYHEDGDMVDLYLDTKAAAGAGRVRLSDFGKTLMRLSYDLEIDTPNKERIFHRILAENGVSEGATGLFLDSPVESLYAGLLQFAQTLAKVGSMRHFRREVIESLFLEQLTELVESRLGSYQPRAGVLPKPERDDLEVNFSLQVRDRAYYLLAVKDATSARLATISCLEFQKAQLKFKSLIVHENIEKLPRKDQTRLTSASDKQFVNLDDFSRNIVSYLEREAA